jgi:mannopine transport system ATP-binding protein
VYAKAYIVSTSLAKDALNVEDVCNDSDHHGPWKRRSGTSDACDDQQLMSMTSGGSHGLEVGIHDVWRRYGNVTAVGGVSLTVGAGEFVSLLGPSGSGKTTLLMMLAGFEEPDEGRLTVGDRDITRLAPNKRDIAMVFQRYALFPHMTVADNIAFPLRMRRVGRAERDDKVRRALAMVKLDAHADRKPAELSGGQQQRVALARAIVFEPPVILMDEPLGALDKKLRQHMQIELRQLQQRLGATVIYVTHDQEEALTMSDRVAVINGGSLAQLGRPRDLYDRPADAFVADFIGEMNLLPATVDSISGDTCTVRCAAGVALASGTGTAPGTRVRLAIRPEHVELAQAPAGDATGLRGEVAQCVFNGASTAMQIELHGGSMLRVDVGARSELALMQPGTPVIARWPAASASVFPESG